MYGERYLTHTEKAAIEQKLAELTGENSVPAIRWYRDTIRELLEVANVYGHARYDRNFGDDRVCVCGHPYYRHFDSYEDMSPCGCKYCECGHWGEGSFKEREA